MLLISLLPITPKFEASVTGLQHGAELMGVAEEAAERLMRLAALV